MVTPADWYLAVLSRADVALRNLSDPCLEVVPPASARESTDTAGDRDSGTGLQRIHPMNGAPAAYFPPEDGYALSDPKRNGPGGHW